MRKKSECVFEGISFLQEMIDAGAALHRPKASALARNWCKAHGYAEYKFSGPSGWVVTARGISKIKSDRPS